MSRKNEYMDKESWIGTDRMGYFPSSDFSTRVEIFLKANGANILRLEGTAVEKPKKKNCSENEN